MRVKDPIILKQQSSAPTGLSADEVAIFTDVSGNLSKKKGNNSSDRILTVSNVSYSDFTKTEFDVISQELALYMSEQDSRMSSLNNPVQVQSAIEKAFPYGIIITDDNADATGQSVLNIYEKAFYLSASSSSDILELARGNRFLSFFIKTPNGGYIQIEIDTHNYIGDYILNGNYVRYYETYVYNHNSINCTVNSQLISVSARAETTTTLSTGVDANTLKDRGYYRPLQPTLALNFPTDKLCHLEVFRNDNNSLVTQQCFTYDNRIFVRTYLVGSNLWSLWKELTGSSASVNQLVNYRVTTRFTAANAVTTTYYGAANTYGVEYYQWATSFGTTNTFASTNYPDFIHPSDKERKIVGFRVGWANTTLLTTNTVTIAVAKMTKSATGGNTVTGASNILDYTISLTAGLNNFSMELASFFSNINVGIGESLVVGIKTNNSSGSAKYINGLAIEFILEVL